MITRVPYCVCGDPMRWSAWEGVDRWECSGVGAAWLWRHEAAIARAYCDLIHRGVLPERVWGPPRVEAASRIISTDPWAR